MRRKYVLAGTNSPGLSDSDGLCRPHPPLRRSPFPKGKVGNSFLGGYTCNRLHNFGTPFGLIWVLALRE